MEPYLWQVFCKRLAGLNQLVAGCTGYAFRRVRLDACALRTYEDTTSSKRGVAKSERTRSSAAAQHPRFRDVPSLSTAVFRTFYGGTLWTERPGVYRAVEKKLSGQLALHCMLSQAVSPAPCPLPSARYFLAASSAVCARMSRRPRRQSMTHGTFVTGKCSGGSACGLCVGARGIPSW